jgi:hypothetical protein
MIATPRASAANLAWSAMQGLLVLYSKMTLVAQLHGQAQQDIEVTVARFGRLLAEGFRSR